VRTAAEGLSCEDRDMLLTIFRKRLRLFLSVFGMLFIVAFLCSLKIDSRHHYFKPDDSNFHISRNTMYIINFCFLGGILFIIAAIIFRKRIWYIYKDARNNLKEIVYYEVTQKSKFAHTHQFFIGLNDPEYLFHEVDEQTWSNISVGSRFGVYKAPLSKYVFNYNGKFTMM
jgi:hypothetical protein